MMDSRIGLYKCLDCGVEVTISSSFTFGGGFVPAAISEYEEHPMYWRGFEHT